MTAFFSTPTGLLKPTGPLGFGTGMLWSIRDRGRAVRLIETAFDSGISYFDTARLYADGLAEGMLGEAFSHRRDQVIVVSKAGILPVHRSLAKRVSDKLLHTARKAPPLRNVLPEPRYAEPTFGVFDIPRLRKSVETSLRQLRTDYLDALLLHECTTEDAANGEIREFVERLMEQGKIRAYGVAPRVEDALEIERRRISFGNIMQVASNAWEDTISRLPPHEGRLLVTHSIFTTRFRETLEKLNADASAASGWRAAFDVDPGDTAAMARLFLRHAMHRNPAGVVLFSTTSPDRIRENLRALASPLTPDQGDLLPKMLKAL